MCFQVYEAHPLCKHPNKIRPRGDNWTRHIEFRECDDVSIANRHARRRSERTYCDPPDWFAELNFDLEGFCASCENTHGEIGDRAWGASRICVDFDTKRDQWEYENRLEEETVQMIQRDIDEALERHKQETEKGPFNNSYYVLREELENYTARWNEAVELKKELEAREAEERETAEAWRQARFSSRVDEAVETSIFPPGFLAQAEASRSQSHSGGDPGSSSDPHHRSTRPHKPNLLQQFFAGKRSSKK